MLEKISIYKSFKNLVDDVIDASSCEQLSVNSVDCITSSVGNSHLVIVISWVSTFVTEWCHPVLTVSVDIGVSNDVPRHVGDVISSCLGRYLKLI